MLWREENVALLRLKGILREIECPWKIFFERFFEIKSLPKKIKFPLSLLFLNYGNKSRKLFCSFSEDKRDCKTKSGMFNDLCYVHDNNSFIILPPSFWRGCQATSNITGTSHFFLFGFALDKEDFKRNRGYTLLAQVWNYQRSNDNDRKQRDIESDGS